MADQNILEWQRNSTDEQGFLIWRNPNSLGQAVFGQIASVGAGVLTYTDLAVVQGTNYCYEVAAFNVNGSSAFSNVACRTVPDTIAPVVTILSPTGSGTWFSPDANVTVSGTATDNLGVAGMFWQNNATGNFGAVTFNAPNWSTVNLNQDLLPGPNLVTISAFDNAGPPSNTGSAQINIIIQTADTHPTIRSFLS